MVKMLIRLQGDKMLEPYTRSSNAYEERQMRIVPQAEDPLFSVAANVALACAVGSIEVPPP